MTEVQASGVHGYAVLEQPQAMLASGVHAYAVLEQPETLIASGVHGYAALGYRDGIIASGVHGYAVLFELVFEFGDVVVATEGAWLHDPSAFAYRWLRDGARVPDAFGPSRMLLEPDEGAMIAVEVRATNPFGSSVTRSDEVGPVLPGVVPAPTGYAVDFSLPPVVFLNSGALEHQRSSSGRYGLVFPEVPEAADAEVLALTVTERNETRFGPMARASGSTGSETLLVAYQGRTNTRFQLAQYDGGAFAQIADEGPDTAGARRIWIRLRVDGGTARARWWYVGDQEPEGWTFEETVAVTGAGRVGLFAFDGAARAYCEYLSAGIDGAVAPLPDEDLATDQYRVGFTEAPDIARFDEWWNTGAASLAYAVHGDAPLIPPRGWTALWEYEGRVDRGSGAFMRLPSAGNQHRRALAYTGLARAGDVELYCEVRPPSSPPGNNHTRLCARLDDIVGTEWGVLLELNGSDTAQILKYVDGASSTVVDTTFAVPGGAWCGMRLRVEGAEILARVWPLSESEPEAWMLVSAEGASDVPAGWPGVGCFSSGGVPDYRKFEVELLEGQ